MRGNFFYDRLGNCIAEARKKHGLSQEELAHRSGIDRTYFARIEEGRANPTIKVLCRIAQALGKRVCRLIAKL